VVPREWNIRDAYIKNARGEKIVDFNQSNLHVMGYSVPVRARMTLADLKKHLHTLPEQPNLIPYRTSYYAENWGFCIAHRQFENLRDETYEATRSSTARARFLGQNSSLIRSRNPAFYKSPEM
jgi:aminopeptidase-like protein